MLTMLFAAKSYPVSMRKTKGDINGATPDRCEMALLLIDVITPLDFPEAGQLVRYVPAMTRQISQLKKRAQKAGVPVIYVNDNFGRWRSYFRS